MFEITNSNLAHKKRYKMTINIEKYVDNLKSKNVITSTSLQVFS